MKPLKILLILLCGTIISLSTQATTRLNQTNDSLQLTTITVQQLDPLHIRTIIDQDGVDVLYQRFERLYGDYIGDNPKPVDFDFLMGKHTSLEAFELREWYLRTLEEGFPVERFNKFGIVYRGDGYHVTDHDDSPHMAGLWTLFVLMNLPRDVKEDYLLSRGFRHSDIDIIEDYLANHNLEQITADATMRYYEHILPQLKQTFAKQHVLSDRQLTGEVFAFMYARTYLTYKQRRNWAVKLMLQLDKQRQRILKQVLVEMITGARSGTEHPHNVLDSGVVKMIRSGMFERGIIEYQQQQQQKIDAMLQGALK